MTGESLKSVQELNGGMERQDKYDSIMGLHFYMYGEQKQGRKWTSGQDEFQRDAGMEVPKEILRIKQLKMALLEETKLMGFLETQYK